MVWPAIIGAAAALAGGALSGDQNRKLAHEQMDMQREFAQMGIRWKVADAKAAGLHPLAALGASTSSYAPISVGDSYGPALSEAGQNISRAMDATRTAQERSEAEARAFQEARERFRAGELQKERENAREDARLASQLKNDEMQRQLLASQIARLNQQRNPPLGGNTPDAKPIEDHRGRKDTGAIKLKPAEQAARNPVISSQEAGSQPMWQMRETAPGVFRRFPHPDTNLDSEIVHAILAGQAYVDQWVSDTFFKGAPKYIQEPGRKGARPSVFHRPPY